MMTGIGVHHRSESVFTFDRKGRSRWTGIRIFGEWTTDRLEIIRSQLSPGGARYTTLASLPLAHH